MDFSSSEDFYNIMDFYFSRRISTKNKGDKNFASVFSGILL
jgi:hypothetical protein